MTDLDDCFRISDQRITVGEALRRFADGLSPAAGIEKTPTAQAHGRILGQDIVARFDTPPSDNSAVDGYVVYFDDLQTDGETSLKVAGRIAAGHPLEGTAKRGEALQIFTGAPVPKGAQGAAPDTIFMVEDCRVEGDVVTLPAGIKRGANLRRAGEDVKTGNLVLKSGRRLRPQDIAMAASLGLAEIPVYRRLKAAVFSTGDEVREPGAPLEAGCIYDANRFAIMAMFERLGVKVHDLGIFPDDRGTIQDALAAAAVGHNLLIASGGVSKGEEDHVRASVEALGAVHFWNLAIKPGRPVALGYVRAGDGKTPFVGLPGNPVAVLVTFLKIARPIVLLLAGAGAGEPVLFKVAANFDFEKKPGRREWLRATLARSDSGALTVGKFADGGSGIISSMVAADGLIELDEELTTVRQGDLVDFLPFNEVMG